MHINTHISIIMQNIDIVLNNGISGGGWEPVSSKFSISPSKSKEATSTNHGHLPLLIVNRVSPQNSDGAAIVLSFGDDKIHSHEQNKLTLWRRSIEPLCLPHQLGVQLRSQSQRVIEHVHQSKARGWVLQRWWHNFNWRRVASTHRVMPVEPKRDIFVK